MENNLLTHTKHETTHFDVLSDKRQTVKVSFLPFAGKINVKLLTSLLTHLAASSLFFAKKPTTKIHVTNFREKYFQPFTYTGKN